jgi:hypothetical protein
VSDFWHSSGTGEKWECNETVHQLFTDFNKAYDFVRSEAYYNILIEFVVPMSALEYAIRKVPVNCVGLKINGVTSASMLMIIYWKIT